MAGRWLRISPLLLLIAVAATIAVVLVTEPRWYLQARYPLHYAGYIRTHARNYGLPPELVAAVVMEESGFDERARSQAGAVGLMQLTPETATGIAMRTGGSRFRRSDLLDPEINVRYGCWYLRHLRDKYRDHGNGTQLALAAYNAGQGRVDRWVAAQDDGQLDVGEIPYGETRQYVREVQSMASTYRRAWPSLNQPA